MLTNNLEKLVKKVLIVCVVSAGLVVSGAAGLISEDESGLAPGRAMTEPVYAADSLEGDHASQVISDSTLAAIVRILTNYSEKTGDDLYKVISTSDEYKEQYEQYGTRITDYPELVEKYDKAINQSQMENYQGFVELQMYPEITDLTGLSSAIRVSGVSVPKNYTEVPGKAFASMMRLKTVLIPDTVTAIGDGAFEKCERLTSLMVYDSDTLYVTAPVDGNGKPISSVIYLKGITDIGNSAFKSCKGLTTVDLGQDDAEYMKNANVNIESSAFSSCTSLADVTVPKGTLGTGVFSSCHALNSIVFDDSYTKIPDNTLSDINGWISVTLPKDLEEIGAYTMSQSGISAINISSCTKLKKIGEHAFWGAAIADSSFSLANTSLTTIDYMAFSSTDFNGYDLKLPSKFTDMGCAAFFSAGGLKSAEIPGSLAYIPDGAFMNCHDLAKVSGGSGVKTIGAHAFDLCSSLSEINFRSVMTNVTSIGDYAFARCVPAAGELDQDTLESELGLRSVDLGDKVAEIGEGAFEDDFMISSIKLGNGIKVIPARFMMCSDSKSPSWADLELTDPISGKTYTFPFKSGGDAGYRAIRETIFNYKNYKGNISQMSRAGAVSMPKSTITEIGDYAFFGNTALEGMRESASELLIPTTVKKIGKYAFAVCARTEGKGEELVYKGIRNVQLPDSIEEIGEYAFNKDYSLYSVKFPQALAAIPEHCFDGCGYDNKYREKYIDGEGKEQQTEERHHYHGLEVISDIRALKSIGDYAFNNCYLLSMSADRATSATGNIEFGRDLEYLGKYAFSNTGIKTASSLMYSKIDKINDYAFAYCRDLTTVYCPDTLTAVGEYAFRECLQLDTVNFPIYATLPASILYKNYQNITMTPTLGRYLSTRYRIPVGETISLPADAFARRNTEKISQIYVDGPDKGKDVEIDNADPRYFTVTAAKNKNQYNITGGESEVLGTALRISASVPFTESSSKTMSIDYPLDIVNTHADRSQMAFDNSGIKIGSSSAGTLFEKDGELWLYVNKSRIGSVLTVTMDGKSSDSDYPGIITDKPYWKSSDESMLALKESSITRTTSADKTTTSAQFDIKGTGDAIVSGGFDDADAADDPEISLHISVVEPIKSIDFTLGSAGESHKNMSQVSMPAGQTDVLEAAPVYTSEEDQRDFMIYKSDDPTIVSIDENGKITAHKAGKARITVTTATGSTSRSLNVTVQEEGAYIEPLYVEITGPVVDGKGIVYCDEAARFSAKCLPEYASQQVEWTLSSEDARLAVEGGDALVTGVNANKSATLKVRAIDGETQKSAQASLTVTTNRRVETVEFKEAPPVVAAGAEKSLRLQNTQTTTGIIRTPAESYDKVTFTSSDPTILTLGTKSGDCTSASVTIAGQDVRLYYVGSRDGIATITASTDSGSTSVLVVKVVADPVTQLTCSNSQVTLLKKRTIMMKLTVTPSSTTDQITFTSSDEKIATVDENGKITAKAAGRATIRARSGVNGKTADCSVRVLGKGEQITIGKGVYTANSDGTMTFYRPYLTTKKITVPDTVKISGNSYKVTKVEKAACRYNYTVTKVVIGKNVKTIGADAFNDSPKLKTFEVKSKVLKKLGKRVVKNCRRGMTIKVPKSKYSKYKKLFKKSGVPAKTKYKKG